MDEIEVSFFIKYLTNRDLKRRDNDWSAFKIRQFIKNEPINGSFSVKVAGEVRTFYNKDKSAFMNVFYNVLARKLESQINETFSIVPIPNSAATIVDKAAFATLKLAQEIADRINGGRAKVVPALRWKAAKKTAHKDQGGRDSKEHFDNLKVVEAVAGPVVVFDDFLTSGSQMKASCRRLLEAGADLQRGLVAARVVHEYSDPVFGWDSLSLPIEDRPIDFDAIFNS